jgi:hypothetical protein
MKNQAVMDGRAGELFRSGRERRANRLGLAFYDRVDISSIEKINLAQSGFFESVIYWSVYSSG